MIKNTTLVWPGAGAGSRSRNFSIPAPAPVPAKSSGSLRLRLHNTAEQGHFLGYLIQKQMFAKFLKVKENVFLK